MKQKGNVAIVVALIIVVAFTVGVVTVVKPTGIKKLLTQSTSPISTSTSEQPLKISGDRIYGTSTLVSKDGYDEIDTAYIKDSIKNAPAGSRGKVISSTLKSGAQVYLVVPPNQGVTTAEIAEYSSMPTTKTHIPLYPDLGFGMNIALEGPNHGTQDPVYLVIDYSKGKIKDEFAALTKKNNRCDFTKPSFKAEVCAMALNIPMGNTIGSKYIAVSPKWAGDSTPTFPIYSYYLGHSDLLVLRLYESTIVIPQPQTKELATDLIHSTFNHYSVRYEGYEAIDLLRKFSLTVSDKEVLSDLVSKAYFEDPKVLFGHAAIRKAIQKSGDTQLLENFDKQKETMVSETLKALSMSATQNRSYNLMPSANLRRAIQSRIIGANKLGATVLTTIHEQFQEGIYDPPSADVLEGINTLVGNVTYKKTAEYKTNVGKVFAQENDGTMWEDDATIVDDDYGEGTDADAEAYDKAADQAEQDMRDAARNEANNIANDPDASFDDLVRGAELAQLIGDDELADKLLDRALKKAMKDMEEAEEEGFEDDFIEAAERCMLLGGSNCNEDKLRQILLKRCQLEVKTKNLHNFADEDVEPVTCEEEIVGSE